MSERAGAPSLLGDASRMHDTMRECGTPPTAPRERLHGRSEATTV
jgi:hypothetical protein